MLPHPQWAVDQLTEFCRLISRVGSGDRARYVGEWTEILQQAQIVEQILDRVVPGWQSTTGRSFSEWSGHREGAQRAIAQIQRDAELREKLGDNAPALDASCLHPWVWDGAKSLWQSGHYREAVRAAAVKVNAETQNRLGRRDLSEKDLFHHAFDDKQPTADVPRLRLPDDDDGKTAKSVRRGIRAFAEGHCAAIRNPSSHDVQDELPETEALEQLAAFSVLARWVDTAEVKAL